MNSAKNMLYCVKYFYIAGAIPKGSEPVLAEEETARIVRYYLLGLEQVGGSVGRCGRHLSTGNILATVLERTIYIGLRARKRTLKGRWECFPSH